MPLGQAEDSFIVSFDEPTGLIRSMEARRYRQPTDETKTPRRLDALGWETFHGIRVPSAAAVAWGQDPPWLVMRVEDVVYNAGVSEYVHASGL